MKTSSLLAFSSLCFALLIGITSAATPEPVLDTSGQKLTTGIYYYIIPAVKGNGGGLTLESTGNDSCPLKVVQNKFNDYGDAVTFKPYNAKNGAILTSTDLNILTYPIKQPCGKSLVWRLLKELTGVWFIATGGVEGNPGADTIVNWFKIEKSGKAYVLSFCPSVCKCSTLCRELGIYVNGVDKHLALSDTVPSFRVKFKKAKGYNNPMLADE